MIFYLTSSSSSNSPLPPPDILLAIKFGTGAMKYVNMTNNGKNLLNFITIKIEC